MENFSNYISDVFFLLSPSMRVVFIFLSSFAEGLPVIGSFFPGGSIALLIGSLSFSGYISLSLAIFVVTMGNFLGDVVGFFIGRKFKHTKWFKRISEKEKHQKSWELFDKHIILIVLFTKVIPIIRSLPSLFAGARGVKVLKYFLFSFIGSLIWAVLGVYGGNMIAMVLGKNAVAFIFCLVIVLSTGPYLVKRFRNRKRNIK